MEDGLPRNTILPGSAGRARAAGLRSALAVAVLAGALVSPFAAAAVGPVGASRPSDAVSSFRVPTHGTAADDLDRAGAVETARHIVDDLSAEKRIDEGWKAAAVAGVETRTMRVFKVWVVHFRSAVDLGGQGSDIFIFMSENGEFLKYSYSGR